MNTMTDLIGIGVDIVVAAVAGGADVGAATMTIKAVGATEGSELRRYRRVVTTTCQAHGRR